MNIRQIITAAVAVAWLLPASLAAAASDEEKLVDEMYGSRLKAAAATAGADDDMVIVQEMLAAAREPANPRKLCAVLALRAMATAMTLDGESAAAEAQKALEIAAGFQPMEPLERARLWSEIASRQLQAVPRTKPTAQTAAARQAAEAMLQYAAALMAGTGNQTRVAELIQKARNLAASRGVTDLREAFDEAEAQQKRYASRERMIAPLLAKLKDATAKGDAASAAKADTEIAEICLRFDGDLRSAAKYLADVKGDNPLATAVKAAADFLDNRRLPPPESCLAIIQTLSDLSDRYRQDAGGVIAEAAADFCQAYLDTGANGNDAIKARLLLTHLNPKAAAAGDIKTDIVSLRKAVNKAYGAIQGTIAAAKNGGVRVTYDFSERRQVEDWTSHAGSWDVGKGVLACKTEAYRNGSASNKLRFSSKKPFKVTFKGAAKYELSLMLFNNDGHADDDSYYYYSCRFSIGREGLEAAQHYAPRWRGSGAIQPGRTYTFEVEYDGTKQFIWRINGVEVRKFDVEPRPYYSSSSMYRDMGFFRVHLGTESSDRTLTVFDEVTIEGDVVLEP